MSTDYSKLDAAILGRIRAGGGASFTALVLTLERIADSIAPLDRWGWPTGYRAIDRRLQVLRKAGRIAYNRHTGKWVIAEVPA